MPKVEVDRRSEPIMLSEVLRPHVSPQGRVAALQVVIAFVAACALWSAVDDILMWKVGVPALNETTTRVIHDALRVTLLGLVAWRGTLYVIGRLEQARRELYQADLETVVRFARAADMMESYRHGHNLRVGLFAREIATEMGLDNRFCQELMQTAMLHDIGEIGMPDALRLKPEPLTAFERLRMMRHVEEGADLLISDRRLLGMACRIARHHHECWDGSGYPDGLSGEDIPIEARIVAVADVFDALVNDRPHRPAFSLDFAKSEIKALAGKQFDQKVVDAFARADQRVNDICASATSVDLGDRAEQMVRSFGLR